MRRRVVEHIPAREAERQLKLGSGGLRDVEFAVQLLQLVHGRADPAIRTPDDPQRPGRAHPGRVRRPRGRRRPPRRLLLPAPAGAPHPAPPPAPDPRRARGRGDLATTGPQHGLPQGPGGGARRAVAAPPTRGASAAREAVLPPAAGGGRPHPRRRRAALLRRCRRPPRRPRVCRSAGRTAPPRGPHQRRLPHRNHPEGVAAGDARVVRGGPRPRCRPLRLPADQRGPGPHPVVSQDAARRGRGGRAAGPPARPPRATSATCSSTSPRVCACSPRT